ncbi:alcohol dehydrogenase, propanol-preferring [Krasilnikoviella flava]|uniref:Alcohol dehydrogenase, propanol-preferring n=1 Tax=Krasilnikoviella flava TaxID=526729 RepID=A0A1T5LPB1_9MICO|nr:alcohol dehydrogenase, propanol-preferring [Krasilnikoviella flava]
MHPSSVLLKSERFAAGRTVLTSAEERGTAVRAVVFENFQTFPELKEVDRPTPGPGEVLLKVAGSGACHSDVSIYREFTAGAPGAQNPPFVLGHEVSGWVEELGQGVDGVQVGDAYLVYGPIGCGRCAACSRGQDTYCENVASMPYLATGIGRDGGMAEYVRVPVRNLVPLGDADPVAAAPLSDAGLTPYHAIKLALPNLAGGGKFALVIGLGGLGQVAVQILTALTGATVIATDTKPEAMERAAANGAVTVPGGEGQVEAIRAITGGRGVDAAFDFVGATPTIRTAQASMARQGRLTVVGIAGGTAEWSFFANPYEATITNTYWGTIEDLHEVVAMYRAGQITPQVQRYSLDQALDAYRDLEAGKVAGRAVVVPHTA